MRSEQVVRLVPNGVFFDQVKELLKEGKKVKITVVGNSMQPTLKNGDQVLLEPVFNIKLGDIVLATYNNGYVLHRVVGWDEKNIRLVGDGNIGQVERVCIKEIWACVCGVYRGNQAIERTGWMWRFLGMGWYVLRPVRAACMRLRTLKTEFNKTDI